MEKVFEVVKIKQETKKTHYKKARANRPDKVVSIIRKEIGDEDREVFLVLALNVKLEVVAIHRAHVGDLSSSIVHPREVFKAAILNNADSIIIAHNHPSGDPVESDADVKTTKRLKECGQIIGIPVLDHIIVSHTGQYNSFRERGRI